VFSLRVNRADTRSVVLDEVAKPAVVNGSDGSRHHPSTRIAGARRPGGKR